MMTLKSVEEKIKLVCYALKKGGAVVVSDNEDRENEGDLICAASKVTYETLNFVSKEARGLMCAPLTSEIAQKLDLPQMVLNNSDNHKTAFTVSVDSTKCTTGISISDRLSTLRALSSKKSSAKDFRRPGHIFPLTAKAGGLFEREGHTEAAVELLKIAKLPPVALICEILNADGTMARQADLKPYCKKYNLPFITIEEIKFYLKNQTTLVSEVARAKIPTAFGEFEMVGFSNRVDNKEHFALVKGDLSKATSPLVRVHSECLTGDLLSSKRCDCGSQLESALKEIEKEGVGAVIYLRQEGRGIGLFNKLKAYKLQDRGLDTIDANIKLGFESDIRDYAIAAAILKSLNCKKIRLLTNNPDKIISLQKYGIAVSERIEIVGSACEENKFYLQTKIKKMGHLFKLKK